MISNEADVNDTPGKRGRKARPPDPDEGPLATFAYELWALKRRAGDPSFATMRTRLGAVASKSSLAAATRGTALPSWETTWEFVRVLAVDQLGADEGETRQTWLARWRAAGDATGQRAPAARRPQDDLRRDPPAPQPPAPRGNRRRIVVAGALMVLIAVLSWLAVAQSAPGPEHTPAARFDDVIFEGDVTFPDGSVVAPGQRFTKVWQLRNTGSIRWEGRYLTRVNSTPCQAPDMAPIPPTDPGTSVRIEVPVTASEAPARCTIFWKMTNESQELLFPGKNPIFLDVVVQE